MAGIVTQRNIAQMGVLKRLSAAAAATAAGTGDATTTTGTTIDRFSLVSGSMPFSASFAVIYDATLGSGSTLSIGYAVQDSADNSSWSDFQTATYAVVATGASGGSTAAGELEIAVNLLNARRYVRLNFNPDLSRGATDTAVARAVGFFGGFDDLPA